MRSKVVIFSGGPSIEKSYERFISLYTLEDFDMALVKGCRPSKVGGLYCQWLFLNDWNLNKSSFKDYRNFQNIVFSYSEDWVKDVVPFSHSAPVLPNLSLLDFFSKSLDVSVAELPFGPGIMLESVLPHLVSAGYRDIICVGWDIGHGVKKINLHPGESFFSYRRKLLVGKLLNKCFRGWFRILLQKFLLTLGFTIRRAGMLSGEFEDVLYKRKQLQSLLAESLGVNLKFIDSNNRDHNIDKKCKDAS